MRILTIPNIKHTARNLLLAGTIITVPLIATSQTKNTEQPVKDIFEKTETVPPKGTTNDSILEFAPNPKITIKGEEKVATIVVDLNKNYLYQYDKNGTPKSVYLIASGKKSTPTDIGVRVVSHVERWPYKSAPTTTKRHKNPNDYGPRAIILLKLDPKTGNTSPTGEFIHGNNKPESIGKYASKGCMRMDNEVIKTLSLQLNRGDIVLIDKF